MGKELQSEESTLEDEESNLEDTSTDVELEEEEEGSEDETVEESVRAALEDITENEGDGDQGEEDQEPGSPDTKESKELPVEPKEEAQEIIPPHRLSAPEKELFNKLPSEFKPAVDRLFRDVQAQFTRTQQTLRAKEKEADHIVQAVRPYYANEPEFAKRGISESQVVSALVGAHQKLMNPKTARQELTQIATSVGYNIKFVDEDGDEIDEGSIPGGGQVAVENSPQFQQLQNTVTELLSERQEQKIAQEAAPIYEQLNNLRSEKAASGKLLYPELQKSSFIQYAKPLVSNLVRTTPGLSHGDAMKMVIQDTRRDFGYSGPSTAKLPTGNKAVRAAVSARGRSAPSHTTSLDSDDVPYGETPEQSARIAYEQVMKGLE